MDKEPLRVDEPTAEQIDLFALLDDLRRSGFGLGVKEYLGAHEIAAAYRKRGATEGVDRLKTWLAPVLCTSPQEQEIFYRRFEERFGTHREAEALPSPPADAVDEDAPVELDEIVRRSNPWRWVLAGAALLAIAVFSYDYLRTLGPEETTALTDPSAQAGPPGDEEALPFPVVPAEAPEVLPELVLTPNAATGDPTAQPGVDPAAAGAPGNPDPSATEDPDPGATAAAPATAGEEDTAAQTATDTELAEELTWPEALMDLRAEIQATLTVFPFVMLACWWSWKRSRSRLVLERRRTRQVRELSTVELAEPEHELYQGATFAEARIKARERWLAESPQLDAAATVAATVERGGLFSPAFRLRLVMPTYLVLVDRTTFSDQQAAFIDEFLDRLVAGGVEIDRFYFDRDPRLCASAQGGRVQSRLGELASSFSNHRLLVFSDGSGFTSPVSGQLARWTADLERWQERALLTPVSPCHWSQRELDLASSGLRVVPASPAGFLSFTESLTAPDPALPFTDDWSPPYPETLLDRPGRWLERTEPQPEEIEELQGQLEAYLGSDGYRWFAALAVFPTLKWHLTLHLGLALHTATGEPVLSEDMLLRLTRLPWLRHGSIPNWLRLRLISDLIPDDAETVRNVLGALLRNPLETPGSGFALELASPGEKRGWKRLLIDLLRTEPVGSPLRDYIFVGFLLGKQPGKLQVLAPRNWHRFAYERGLRGLGMRGAAALVMAVLVSMIGFSSGLAIDALHAASLDAGIDQVVEVDPPGIDEPPVVGDDPETAAIPADDPGVANEPTASAEAVGASTELVRVTSTPRGARITLDGELLADTTPAELTLEPNRTHNLVLQLSGYETASWAFTLEDVVGNEVFFPLVSDVPPGILSISAPGYPVVVTINPRDGTGGRVLGVAEAHEVPLRPGRYDIQLENPAASAETTMEVSIRSVETTSIGLAPGNVAGSDPRFALIAGPGFSGDAELLRLRQDLDLAQQAFDRIVDQPDSIPMFSRIIAALEQRLSGGPDSEATSVLVSSLGLRAQAAFNAGDLASAEADIRTLIAADATATLDRDSISPRFLELFDTTYDSLVGHARVLALPADAMAQVDDLAPQYLPLDLPLLAGDHTVVFERPGYRTQQMVARVVAGETVRVIAELVRTSAVVEIFTRPAGATIVVDGVELGATSGTAPADFAPTGTAAAYPRAEFSDAFLIDALQPGTHTIVATVDGYRPVTAQLAVADLSDYSSTIVFAETAGTVVFEGLAADSLITVDGEAVTPNVAANLQALPELTLRPGPHEIEVSRSGTVVFADTVNIVDAETEVIDLRGGDGLTFLGVLGGDTRAEGAFSTALRDTFSDESWPLLDRSATAPDILDSLGVDADLLRAVATGGVPEPDWDAVQAALDARLPGSLYVIGVLNDDLVASSADLWFLSSAPGPAAPDRVTVRIDDTDALDLLADEFPDEGMFERAWLGATILDPGPVVADVVAGGPAEAAGVRAGFRIRAVGGISVSTALQVTDAVEQASPGDTLEFTLPSGARFLPRQVTLGSSPVIAWPEHQGRLSTPLMAALSRNTDSVFWQALTADTPQWVVQANQAAVLMHAGAWEDAVRTLRGIEAPTGPGVGEGTVQYMLASALAELGPNYRDVTIEAFRRAAAVTGARLQHNDGPLVPPRARLRIAELGGQ